MATITQIHAFRIEIGDPSGALQIVIVATSASLPSTPQNQTVYYITDTARYVQTDIETGAVVTSYTNSYLSLSDAKIGALIDTYGSRSAVCQGLKAILKTLGAKLQIVRNKDGAEETEYVKLLDLYNYYKNLIATCEDDEAQAVNLNTGRYLATKKPTIAGGNV